MSLLQSLFGNASQIDGSKVQAEFQDILIEGEQVAVAFQLFRDMLIMTNYRLITVDKQGVSGSKQEVASIPWKSIKKFSCENAGFMDGDGELKVWVTGDTLPTKWGLAKSINIRTVYNYLSRYVLAA